MQKKWNKLLNKKTELFLYIKKFEEILFQYMSYKSYTDYCSIDNKENYILLQKKNKKLSETY